MKHKSNARYKSNELICKQIQGSTISKFKNCKQKTFSFNYFDNIKKKLIFKCLINRKFKIIGTLNFISIFFNEIVIVNY